MKTLLCSILLFAATTVAQSATRYMYSPDGVTVGSDLRALPSQGVSRSTGKVVVGLHGLTDLQRMDCGWYRYTPVAKPDTNHYWRVTNYVFSATGTVENVWSQYTPVIVKNYSKAAIIENLAKLDDANGSNKWEIVKAEIESEGLMDLWNAATYIEANHPAFIAAKPKMMALLGVSEVQLDNFLDTCIY